MKAQRGYYSLVQFCPDFARLEAVNLGVVLFCPADKFIAARTTRSNRRAAQLVGKGRLDRSSLDAAKIAIERRFEVDRERFLSVEDLQKFVDTRGNVLQLTDPRPVKVFDASKDLERLFYELVGGQPRRSARKVVFPELDAFFQHLKQSGRARLDWDLTVPIVHRPLHVPYAYRNGVWNLVKPYQFSTQEGKAIGAAMRLAMEGDLLQKHATEDQGRKQLIVVSAFEAGENHQGLQEHVESVLSEYRVRTVSSTQLPTFLKQVEQDAHFQAP